MMRGSSTHGEGIDTAAGLGPHLVGRQIDLRGRPLELCQQLGEGGFSFVYLVRVGNGSSGNGNGGIRASSNGGSSHGNDNLESNEGDDTPSSSAQSHFPKPGTRMVLKITSVHNEGQRHMAEKEAKMLQNLSHPSIVQVYDHCFREGGSVPEGRNPSPHSDNAMLNSGHAPPGTGQHLILMEHCEGGNAFDAIQAMRASGRRFDLPSLVISFGQICNAVSYLHAQRPPLIHRDLKPVNFLIKNGAYKLCDFGSAVVGHTDLRTPECRRKAEEVVAKTTTQMFRAPEMVDLHMAKKLTQATDVWALGCCLYSLAFLRDCFEEGSNLAILSRKYKIPDDNPYGEGIVDLLDRMLAADCKERADMSEVIMCLSALYSHRSLPTRKKRAGKAEPKNGERGGHRKVGAYRTDGQGVNQKATVTKKPKVPEAKKLNPNSAAAKRKKASEGQKQTKAPTWNEMWHEEEEKPSVQSPSSTVDNGFENFASFDGAFQQSDSDPFDGFGSSADFGASSSQAPSSAGRSSSCVDELEGTFQEFTTSVFAEEGGTGNGYFGEQNGSEFRDGASAIMKAKRGLLNILGKSRT